MRGDIDMLYEVSRDAADFVQAESNVKTYTFPRPYYIRSGLQRAASDSQERPRCAGRSTKPSTGRRSIRDGHERHGAGRPTGPICARALGLRRRPRRRSSSIPTAARLRLDAARSARPAVEGRQHAGRLSFTCLVFGDDPRFERLAVLLQRQLADVGIEMRLEAAAARRAQRARRKAGDFDAFLFEMAGRSLSWVYEFWHSQEARARQQRIPRRPMPCSTASSGRRRRREPGRRWPTAAKILHDDPPAAFLAWQEQTAGGLDEVRRRRRRQPRHPRPTSGSGVRPPPSRPLDETDHVAIRAAHRHRGGAAAGGLRRRLDQLAAQRHRDLGARRQPQGRQAGGRAGRPCTCSTTRGCCSRSASELGATGLDRLAAGPHPQGLRPAISGVPGDHALRLPAAQPIATSALGTTKLTVPERPGASPDRPYIAPVQGGRRPAADDDHRGAAAALAAGGGLDRRRDLARRALADGRRHPRRRHAATR